MGKIIFFLTVLFLVTLVSGPLLAQEPFVYPAKGQSNEQMDVDKYACYNWAKKHSGFDPMTLPKATSPAPQPKAKGSTAGSAATGALVGAGAGAAISAIAGGDAGTGAAIGALGGGLFGGMKKSGEIKDDQRRQQQWEKEQANNYARNRDGYNRAYSACLEGRGYTVK